MSTRFIDKANWANSPIRQYYRKWLLKNHGSDSTESEDTPTMATEVNATLVAPLGSTTGAASIPVVIASDQVLPLPTGAATQTTLAAASAKLPSALGQTTMSASMSVTIASDQSSLPVSTAPSAAIGASTFFHLISAGTTNATSVKGSAGTVNLIIISNVATTKRYVKFYNKATAPTVGTDTPVITIMIPPGETHDIAMGPAGTRFATGIALATTTLITDADTTAVTANDLAISVNYT